VPISTKHDDNSEEKHSLYAITMGNGWQTVQPFVDYNFQRILPVKILNSEGANITEIKSVLGNTRSNAAVYRNVVSLEDLEYGDICTTFSADLDTKDITEGKSRQQQIFPSVEAKQIKVEVGVGRIKFLVQTDFPNLVKAINELEAIYTEKSDKYNIVGSKLNRRVSHIGYKEKLQLDQELTESIRTLLGPRPFNSNERLPTFDICHKFPKEYTQSTKITLSFANQTETLEENPDLHDVLEKAWNILWNEPKSKEERKESEKNLEAPRLLWNIKISFASTGDKVKSREFHELPKMLRGSFFSKTYQKFFLRFGETWYDVDDDYVIGIQTKFQNILQNHLIVDRQFGPLHLSWPMTNVAKHNEACKAGKTSTRCRGCAREKKSNKDEYWVCDEGVYNNLYKDMEGYYVGDCKTPRSIEYFDVVLDRMDQSYFCHVKRGFGNQVRDVCSQLLNSCEMLTALDYRGRENRESSKIEELVKRIFNNDEEKAQKVLNSPNSKVFVMGVCTNENPVLTRPFTEKEILKERGDNLNTWEQLRSLEAEKDLKQIIDESDLAKYINDNKKFKEELMKAYKCNSATLYGNLISSLKKNHFIKPSKAELLVTSKLLLCDSQSDFKGIFPSVIKTSEDILLKSTMLMLQKYTTHYDSLAAKLELIRCVKILLNGREPTQFRICEIFIGGKIEKATPLPSAGDLIDKNMEVDEPGPTTSNKISGTPKVKSEGTTKATPSKRAPLKK
jgi:hypothetical protein